ncbi:MAG: MetQ/NlpA family ABC transporter substrate-binding protein [Eubacteriales bacterium]|nr:MetQ/NlpA family ABC transporter substrate-binding protein [Eubacteriales bacterium]
MKRKALALASSLVLGLGLLAGCGSSASTATAPAESAVTESTAAESAGSEAAGTETASGEESGTEESTEVASKGTITVAATPVPHAEILEAAKPLLEAQGWTLDIVEFTDYVQPNEVVESGDVDANYFQHVNYLNSYNEEKGTHLVNVGEIHYEPLGIYPGKSDDLSAIADGAEIAVPNDTTNCARALLLLEAQGLIKLDPEAGITATENDIVENPHNITIVPLAAEQVARTLPDVDFGVINGNYALEAGLSTSDAVAVESSDSEAIQQYVNVIAVREGNEDNEGVKALVNVLKSDDIKDFINEKYQGSVVPYEG